MTPTTTPSAAAFPSPAGGPGRTIPFDYVFRFELKGEPEKTHKQTVVVSIEGSFTAVAIGYGVVAAAPTVREFGPDPSVASAFVPFGISAGGPQLIDLRFEAILDSLATALGERGKGALQEIGPRTEAALRNGIRINPRFATAAFFDGGRSLLDPGVVPRLFEVVPLPTGDIQFLYAIRDEGSGREFQSEAVLNTAGLGIANGDRPFRQFSRPMTFEPRATIRIDVTELSRFAGLLHVSLQGYKVFGAATAAASRTGGRRGR
jgi:hypothetical protein